MCLCRAKFVQNRVHLIRNQDKRSPRANYQKLLRLLENAFYEESPLLKWHGKLVSVFSTLMM